MRVNQMKKFAGRLKAGDGIRLSNIRCIVPKLVAMKAFATTVVPLRIVPTEIRTPLRIVPGFSGTQPRESNGKKTPKG